MLHPVVGVVMLALTRAAVLVLPHRISEAMTACAGAEGEESLQS